MNMELNMNQQPEQQPAAPVQQQQLGPNTQNVTPAQVQQPTQLPPGNYHNQGGQIMQNTAPNIPGQVAPPAVQQQAPPPQPPKQGEGIVIDLAPVIDKITGQPKTGIGKNNQPWKLMKVGIDITGLGMRHLSTFGNVPEVGQHIQFHYTETPNPNGQYPFLNLKKWWPLQPQQQAFPAQGLNEFVAEYKAALQGQASSVNHFVGTFYINAVKDINVQQLIQLYTTNFGQ